MDAELSQHAFQMFFLHRRRPFHEPFTCAGMNLSLTSSVSSPSSSLNSREERQHDKIPPDSPTMSQKKENPRQRSVASYACAWCGKTFRRKHHRERHVANIHKHQRPHVCKVCAYAFHQKPNLDRHMAIHARFQYFTCKCGHVAKNKSCLARHVQEFHA